MKPKDFVTAVAEDSTITVFGGQSDLEEGDEKSFNAKFLSTTPEVSMKELPYTDAENKEQTIKFGSILMNLTGLNEAGEKSTQTENVSVNTSLMGILQSNKVDLNENYGCLAKGIKAKGSGNIYTRYEFMLDPMNEVEGK